MAKKATAKKTTQGRVSAKSAKHAPATPKLLSGGNPQIATADGDAPVQQYIDAMPGWKREVGIALDTLITELVPDVRKAVRWNTPFYGIEGQGWFVSFHCITRYFKVAFLNGSSLDPLPPVESKHASVRYVHIHEKETTDVPQLTKWIRQAAKIPGERLF